MRCLVIKPVYWIEYPNAKALNCSSSSQSSVRGLKVWASVRKSSITFQVNVIDRNKLWIIWWCTYVNVRLNHCGYNNNISIKSNCHVCWCCVFFISLPRPLPFWMLTILRQRRWWLMFTERLSMEKIEKKYILLKHKYISESQCLINKREICSLLSKYNLKAEFDFDTQ